VGGNDYAQPCGLFHGREHYSFVLNPGTIVRKGAAMTFQGGEVHQLKAFPAHGDGAVGKYPYYGVPADGFLLYG